MIEILRVNKKILYANTKKPKENVLWACYEKES